MRWPWQRHEEVDEFHEEEVREAGGDYSSTIIALAEQQALGNAADVGRTAAVEAASGALGRAFASARVDRCGVGSRGRHAACAGPDRA